MDGDHGALLGWAVGGEGGVGKGPAASDARAGASLCAAFMPHGSGYQSLEQNETSALWKICLYYSF